MSNKRKHEQPLPKHPYDGPILPGDRVVFLMPPTMPKGKSYPVGGEVVEYQANGDVTLRKLSIVTDPNIQLIIPRTRIRLNKGGNGSDFVSNETSNVLIVWSGATRNAPLNANQWPEPDDAANERAAAYVKQSPELGLQRYVELQKQEQQA